MIYAIVPAMTFPDKKYPSAGAFTKAYFDTLSTAAASVDGGKVAEAARVMSDAYERRATVFSCGNGGSAAISNHLHCDHMKGCQTDTHLKPRVVSLSSTIETITAIANDYSYDDIFQYQLQSMADVGDVLVTVSSSGNSENIVRACTWAKENRVHVISMTGFDGGRSAKLADINLHVESDNYGIIEDMHQSLMHVLAQYIRLEHMDDDVISDRAF